LKRYLDYRAIRSGEAISAARADYQNVARERLIEKTFPDAWHRLVEDEDELLLELIADRVESLCGYKPNPDTVAEFLKKRVDLKSATTQPSVYPPVQPVTSLPPPISPPPIHPLGRVGFTLNGRFQPSRNARDVLAKVFIEFADRNSTFLERFASLPKHGRTRRYLARTPNELYPERPDLARDFSQEIKPGWWLGINLSRAAIYRIIRMACEVAGLRFDTDIKVDLGD
jgi:hypothetical protein